MHSFDVERDVLVEIPPGTEIFDHVTSRESCSPPMVFILEIRCRGWKFAPVNRAIRPYDDGPCVRVGGRLAGELAGIELSDGGVDVFEVERNGRYDPLLYVDLDDVEGIVLNRL